MRKFFLFLCAMAVFILASAGFSSQVYANEMIRVGLLRAFYNQNSITVTTTDIEIGRGASDGSFIFNRTLHSPSGFVIQVEGGQVVIRAGGQLVFTFLQDTEGSPQIRATGGGTVTMGRYSYRGVIEFRPYGGRVTAINVLPLEQYLYGVVPMEMSPSFHFQALKAQAVAARTFAVYNRNYGRRHSAWIDVCDSTCCQVYHGTNRESDIITQAIRDTHGLLMYINGRAAFTPFFSSSGGATDNSENVWVQALSHLRGVPDLYETNARIWTRTYTWAQLTAAVQAEAPAANIGNVTGVSITRTHLGRVQELTFIGTNGQWAATGERTRTIFRHVGGSLYGRNYQLAGAAGGGAATVVSVTNGMAAHQAPVNNFHVVTGAGNVVPINTAYVFDGITTRRLTEQVTTVTGGTGITINGRGWGHGVGMSQHGANGMAHAGHDFRTILQHYYTGVEIR